MSSNVAELTLLIKAKNLVDIEVDKVKASLGTLVSKAKVYANDMSDAFKNVGRRIGRQLGNLATDILTGGNLQQSLLYLGATLAGAAVEGMAAHFIPDLLARVMSTAAMAPIATAMAAEGATLGSVMGAAIAVGAAAFPFILLALVVAALIYVATNPEFREKVKKVALEIIDKIRIGLSNLAHKLSERFRDGVEAVRKVVAEKIGAVIKFFTDIPGKVVAAITALRDKFREIMDAILTKVRRIINLVIEKIKTIVQAVKDAIAWLAKLLSMNTGSAYKDVNGNWAGVPGMASGGWVGLNGPQLAMVGEKGPEYIIPNHQLGQGGGGGGTGVRIVGVSAREIADIVDRELYVRIQRAAPTLSRT